MRSTDGQLEAAVGQLPDGALILTGATGFLGGVLVRRLLANGLSPLRLRCIVRDRDRALRAGVPEQAIVVADLASDAHAETLRHAARDVRLVVHLAGALKSFDRRGFDAVNVRGTERLVAAVASMAPDAHFVQVSSLAAAGPSVDGGGSDLPPDRCRPVSSYGESKCRGELAVAASGLPFTILRPPVVYGPNDGATRFLFRQALAPITAVPLKMRPLSVIHADDVAESLWLAMLQRPEGTFLPLDGSERSDTHALLRAIAVACERRIRLVPVPMAVAAFGAHLADLLARLRRSPSYFNRDKVREIGADGWVADGSAAKRLLGFEARIALADGLRAVAEAEGLVK